MSRKKTLASIPDNERTSLSHLSKDTLVTGFLVVQDDKQIIVILISEFISCKAGLEKLTHLTTLSFRICLVVLVKFYK